MRAHNIRVLIIRIGFGGPLYCNYNKELPFNIRPPIGGIRDLGALALAFRGIGLVLFKQDYFAGHPYGSQSAHHKEFGFGFIGLRAGRGGGVGL